MTCFSTCIYCCGIIPMNCISTSISLNTYWWMSSRISMALNSRWLTCYPGRVATSMFQAHQALHQDSAPRFSFRGSQRFHTSAARPHRPTLRRRRGFAPFGSCPALRSPNRAPTPQFFVVAKLFRLRKHGLPRRPRRPSVTRGRGASPATIPLERSRNLAMPPPARVHRSPAGCLCRRLSGQAVELHEPAAHPLTR